MYVFHKPTGSIVSWDAARADALAKTGAILAFSDEGLSGSDYEMIDFPVQPAFDPRYFAVEPVNPVVVNGRRCASWELVPASDDISHIEKLKIQDIDEAHDNVMKYGFYSSAIGSPHRYACDLDSKTSLIGNLLAATHGKVIRHVCYSAATGERVKAIHQPEQMTQVGLDMQAFIWEKLDKQITLKDLIADCVASNDMEALLSIHWDM